MDLVFVEARGDNVSDTGVCTERECQVMIVDIRAPIIVKLE